MRFAWMVARRYLTLQRTRLVAVISSFCIAGVATGVAALVVAMALMSGYRRDLREKLVSANAAIIVFSIDDRITGVRERLAEIEAIPGVAAAAPVVYARGLAVSEESSAGAEVTVKGIDLAAERRVSAMTQLLPKTLEPGKVILGSRLAEDLRVAAGGPVQILVPSMERGSKMVRPRTRTLVAGGTFQTGFHEYDASWAVMPIADAQLLLGAPGLVNLIEVQVERAADTDAVVTRLRDMLGFRFVVTGWEQMNRQLFAALALQQVTLFFALALIVAVSTFSILSTLVMLVHEKRRDIGVLVALGSTRRLVRWVFTAYGLLLGIAGTALGVGLGCGISWIVTTFRLLRFPPEIARIYFVSSIPLVVDPADLVRIVLFALAVTGLAAWIPATRAARLDPVAALRYE